MANREIKFRGKSVETGEWVYGGYIPANGDDPLNPACIYDNDIGYMIQVDPKTVGQYTGYKDGSYSKEPVEVYEDDRLEWQEGSNTKTGVVEWPTFYKDEPRWRTSSSDIGFAYLFDNFAPIVVGNTHDQ